MPIRPQFRYLYPIDWPQLSKLIRFGRARGRCEGCGRPHMHKVRHLGDGRWWDEDRQTWRDGRGRLLPHLVMNDNVAEPPTLDLFLESRLEEPAGGQRRPLLTVDLLSKVRVTKVVLATAHLDHDTTNSAPRNLKALCQRCHMIHDRPEHRRRRWLTLRMRKALGDLFQ